VSIGLVYANVIKPARVVEDSVLLKNRISYELWAKSTGRTTSDGACYACQPENQALVMEVSRRDSTALQGSAMDQKLEAARSTQGAGPLSFLVDMVPSNIFISLNSNGLMLQVIFFGLFFGIALLLLPADQAAPMKALFHSGNAVFLKMVDLVMKAAPFLVFALIVQVVTDMVGNEPGKVIELFKGLGLFALTVVLGLGTMVFGIYPLVVGLVKNGISYRGFLKGMREAQLLAFSTSSSAATLPVTLKCVEENLGVSKRISTFVLPIGATVNMDGTSMYQAITAIFLAQFYMVDLDFSQQMTILVTAVLASIGTAAVPSAGIIMLLIVLDAVGLNPAWVAVVLPVDRILDMMRTVVNVTGDAAVATTIAHMEGDLHPQQHEGTA
jgi:Na+/H+-dicarboxylate symporter